MTDPDIADTFRRQELERRLARMKIMNNHVLLNTESLTQEEKEIDARAKSQLQAIALRLEKQITPGYWQRLWAAIRGL